MGADVCCVVRVLARVQSSSTTTHGCSCSAGLARVASPRASCSRLTRAQASGRYTSAWRGCYMGAATPGLTPVMCSRGMQQINAEGQPEGRHSCSLVVRQVTATRDGDKPGSGPCSQLVVLGGWAGSARDGLVGTLTLQVRRERDAVSASQSARAYSVTRAVLCAACTATGLGSC